MRYTEKEYNFEYSSFTEWINNSIALVIVAPLRLINEISTKIIYLDKKIIIKVLNLAVFLSALCTAFAIVLEMWQGDFDLFVGKIPVILRIASVITLIIFDMWFQHSKFSVYDRLTQLIPTKSRTYTDVLEKGQENVSKGSAATSKPNSFEEFNDEILTELKASNIQEVEPQGEFSLEELSNKLTSINDSFDLLDGLENVELDLPFGDPAEPLPMQNNFGANEPIDEIGADLDSLNFDIMSILNDEIVDDEEVIAYKNEAPLKVEELDIGFSEVELEEKMEKSTDPSKYVDEENLFRFLKDIGADSFGTVDMFTGWEKDLEDNLFREA